MKKLIQILEVLKPVEIQQFIQAYESKYAAKKNKRIELLSIILQNRTISDQGAAEILYGQKPNSTFSHLKSRLYQDLLNFIVLSSFQNPELSHRDTQEISCLKNYIQSKFLLSRNLREESFSMINKVKQSTQIHDFPIIGLLAEDVLIKNFSSYDSFQKLDYFNSYKLDYQLRIEAFQIVNEIVTNIISINCLLMVSISKLHDLQEKINELEQLNETVLSINITAVCCLTKMVLLYCKNEFDRSIAIGLAFVGSLERDDLNALNHDYLVLIHGQLAKSYYRIGEYEPSVDNAVFATEIPLNNTLLRLYSFEILFFIYFRSGNYTLAEEVLHIGDQLSDEIIYDAHLRNFHKSKWSYFRSCLLFKKRDFKNSLKQIRSQSELVKFKTPWALGARILELQNICEISDYDWYASRLEAFRKFSDIHSTLFAEFGTRLFIIQKLFNCLLRFGFNYSAGSSPATEVITTLNLEFSQSDYDPFGFEVINVKEWILER